LIYLADALQADLEMMKKKQKQKQGYQYWQSNRHKVHTEKKYKK